MKPGDRAPGWRVIERGWLSSNGIFFIDSDSTALVDSGYCTHSAQTLSLLKRLLGGRPLDRLLNSHLHSDHCGGNAALQSAWPTLQTSIPPGLANAVARWDTEALGYSPTGQACPRFRFSDLIQPGSEVRLGGAVWEVHAAPGHDPDALILFEPATRTLISADALWEDGFGVIFPELDGESGFSDVAATLDLIERLMPDVVIPGHGRVFSYDTAVMARARTRLERFESDPASHARHAAKVLIKFKLLDHRAIALDLLQEWARATPYFARIRILAKAGLPLHAWIDELVRQLVRGGAAREAGGVIHDASI
jgi:glyoxylase-like metal-dependent hydrolase (beta-lactamase superfamily II)